MYDEVCKAYMTRNSARFGNSSGSLRAKCMEMYGVEALVVSSLSSLLHVRGKPTIASLEDAIAAFIY